MVDAVDVFPYFSPTKKELNFLAKLYVINEKTASRTASGRGTVTISINHCVSAGARVRL